MDESNHITLNWTGFKNMSNLKPDDLNQSGIYLWGFAIKDNFIPYYVGIAEDIVFRISEHISCILSGKYTIYHKISFTNFKESKSLQSSEEKPGGKIFTPQWPKNYYNFLDHRKELTPHINFMVDNFTFAYAIVERKSDLWKNIKVIEKICINKIGSDILANTRAGDSKKYTITHKGNADIINLTN